MQSVPLEGVSLKPAHLVRLGWLDRAVQVYNYHANLCKENKEWTIEKTANMLNRSVGSVSQDITVAQWVPTHGKHLRRFHSMRDALEYIREKKREMRGREIELT
jgi:hypothetical protein